MAVQQSENRRRMPAWVYILSFLLFLLSIVVFYAITGGEDPGPENYVWATIALLAGAGVVAFLWISMGRLIKSAG